MNHYEMLDVNQSATQDEIKRAYRNKMQSHQNETDPEMFMQIRAVYEVLIDPLNRKSYDEGLALGDRRLNLLEALESKINTSPDEVVWKDVEPLMPFADQSERVAAAALQSCYFLDRFEEAIDFHLICRCINF
ncbi:J domain-containing protein [Acinetobacter soli]